MINRRILWILSLTAVFFTLTACAIEQPAETDEPTEDVTNPVEETDNEETETPTDEPEPTNTPEPEPTDTPEPVEEEPTPEPIEEEPAPEPVEEEPTAEPIDISDLPGEPATIVNDEGGPVNITGVVTYTSPFFTLGVTAPVVILEDQAGFVDRDENYIFPVESQALGQITSDFFTSPFTYSLALPIEPQGGFRDVDNDGEADQGVQVFAVAYWTNTYGDPFLEERDLGGGGWSGSYASTIISTDPDFEREIVGGIFLVFAQDDQQGFPSGFGDDQLLFTEDDPIVSIPAGYTIVDINSEPFIFDRSRNPVVDLLEAEGAALVDYSEETYTEAFNGLVDQLINEYAFTDYKGINWEALRAEFSPFFEEADANEDADLYLRALRDFAWRIPDGHVSGPFIGDEFRENVLGGLGLAMRELDDGRAMVTFVVENSPASDAGIEERAEITAVNGVPVTEHIDNTIGWTGPYSTSHAERLAKQQFALRFPTGSTVELTYTNPGGSSQTVSLNASSELDSYFYWFEDDDRDGFELPVEYELLDSGVGYVNIFSFSDNSLLAITLWERMIRTMKDEGVTDLIIDMRTNGGGLGSLANNMSAYFFQETFPLGNSSFWDDERGEFYADPENVREFVLPPEDLRFDGNVVVLVGPDCASACEFFSFNFTITDRATVVGHFPSGGLGGAVDSVAMPEDENFRFTQGRAVGPDGNIHIEGIGVVPDIRVPITEETLFDQEDAVLETAVAFLVGEIVDKGPISIGESIDDTILPGQKFRYTLTLSEDDVFDMLVDSNTDGVNLILTVLDENDNVLAETEPDTRTGFVDIALGDTVTLILEVSTEDNKTQADFTISVADAS
ncbi:MAG: S41 family peptidase [Chloroflexota bacterium]